MNKAVPTISQKFVAVDDLIELCDVREGASTEALSDVWLQCVEGGAVMYRRIKSVELLNETLEVTTDDKVPRYFRRPYDFVSVLVRA